MGTIIVVNTYSDKRDVLNKISSELLSKHLVASTHITKVYSHYRWQGKLYDHTEYLLDVRTSSAAISKVMATIKNMHNYELPEITYHTLYSTDETAAWVRENINTKFSK